MNSVLSSYWVCEKSDGIRVLVLIYQQGKSQDVFLVKHFVSRCYYRERAKFSADQSTQPLSPCGWILLSSLWGSFKATSTFSVGWGTSTWYRHEGWTCKLCEKMSDFSWRGQKPQQILRLLIFDCLVIDEENVMEKSLLKRTGVSAITLSMIHQYWYVPFRDLNNSYSSLLNKCWLSFRIWGEKCPSSGFI